MLYAVITHDSSDGEASGKACAISSRARAITVISSDTMKPTIEVTSRALDDSVEIEVRDNGAGIPDTLREKIFLPFFTTKPAGEGTGLGLSLSYDIIVKQHGGTLTVDSKPGEYTVFAVSVPRRLPQDIQR